MPELPVALRTGLGEDREAEDILLLSERCQSQWGRREGEMPCLWGGGGGGVVARRTVTEPECSSKHESWDQAIESPKS